uniref:Uncharacterized protein n=1 Tax=Anguilla anguilla TaxID=7936 RepID=A0A0E9UV67_ANGAN
MAWRESHIVLWLTRYCGHLRG